MHMMIFTNTILVVNNVDTIHCIQLFSVRRLCGCDSCVCQQSVNDFWCYTFGNQWAALSHPSKVNVSVGVVDETANYTHVATSKK